MNIIEWTHRINYKDFYILILPDMAAGSQYPRYTVYKIPSSPANKTKIIGRELDIRTARKIAKQYENDISKQVKKVLKKYNGCQ